jgi:hypothetical protein
VPVPNDHRVWGGAASGREPKKSLAFARPWASVFEDSYVVVDNSIFTNNKPQRNDTSKKLTNSTTTSTSTQICNTPHQISHHMSTYPVTLYPDHSVLNHIFNTYPLCPYSESPTTICKNPELGAAPAAVEYT